MALLAALASLLALTAACSAQSDDGPAQTDEGAPPAAPPATLADLVEDQKLVIADAHKGDIYGAAVALDASRAVVACEYDDEVARDAGSVRVFRQDGERWVEEQTLLAPDGQAGDNFGRSVAVQGDRIVVGAHWDDDLGPDAGSAWVFRRDGGSWAPEAKLLADDGRTQDRFGVSVALDGELIGVAAWLADGEAADTGAVYLFRHDGEHWVAEQKLVAPDAAAGANFGRSVSVSGERVLVGAWKDGEAGQDAGAGYVFRRTEGRWELEQKLLAAEPAPGDLFGWCVWLDGPLALVGAHKADAAATDSGAATVFRRDGEHWVAEQTLVAPDGAADDWFGFSVALHDGLALVGAHKASTPAGRSGAAYVFRRREGRWVATRRLIAGDGAAGDAFGFQVATHAGRALVGAWRTAQAGAETGSAYLYGAP